MVIVAFTGRCGSPRTGRNNAQFGRHHRIRNPPRLGLDVFALADWPCLVRQRTREVFFPTADAGYDWFCRWKFFSRPIEILRHRIDLIVIFPEGKA